ncbi:MAG: IS4 family transposase, partial [Gammaproteobacteria bacterium]
MRDWNESYGYEPVVLESFVDAERFSGISYRAANWVELGETRGRGRQDRAHAFAGTKKKVFVYPLCEGWRAELGVERSEGSGDWAERELGRARFGDRRLTQRLVSIARDFYARSQANIPKACNGERAKVKAVYRFLGNEDVTLAKLLEPHQEQTRRRMAEHKVVLAVQDSTSLNYTAHALATEGLGPIGTKQSEALGLIVHDTVAVTPQGLALGVLDAQVWVRDWEDKEAGRRIEQKESIKWLRSYEVAAKLQAELKKTRVVSVGDREADLYELFATAREHIEAGGPHLLVRATEDRCLADTAETSRKLWEKVEAQPLAGYREIVVPPRPGRKTRKAKLSVRFCEVVLSPPQGK